ncbi:MAG: radical SAM protein [Gammaproteobacteria bacterium]|nr:MAG: radical SAM protein [Gammaproteobacteria bacterium]
MAEHISPIAETTSATSAGASAVAPVKESKGGAAKVNLLGLSEAKLIAFFETLGEPKFRAVQVLKWIHQLGADNFEDMTNVSKSLRAKLNLCAEIRAPEVIKQLDSTDGTRKFLIRVSGGNVVETVYIPEGDRGTLCVSSQVGCSLDCSFCATGKQGFNRDLTAAEIIGQVWIAAKSFGQLTPNGPRAVTNVVMMGMGEPLLNFDNVVDSMNLMMHDNAYGISKRRVTLSTSGVDRPHHAHELAELLRDVPVKINLIPFNPFNLSNYKRVSNNALRKFQDILIEAGYIATVRTTRGDDIDAACGQLAGTVNDITKRSERHRARFEEAQPIKIIGA